MIEGRFRKAAFVAAVFTFWLLLFVVILAANELVLPIRRGPDGPYPSTNRGPMVMIALAIGAFFANRAVSRAFHAIGLSDGRWSVFARKR